MEDGLQEFRVLAEELSFTRSAALLGTTSSTVSRRIASLERRLGVPLFERTTRRVELTEAGRALRSRMTEIDALWRRTKSELGSPATPPPATVRVRTYPVKARVLIEEFARHLPDLSVVVDANNDVQGALDSVARGVAAAALHWDDAAAPRPGRPGLLTTVVADEPSWVAMHRGHRLSGAAVLRLADLADEDWILAPAGHPLRELEDRAFAAAGLRPREGHVAEDVSLVRSLLQTGRFVTLASATVPPNEELSVVPLADPPVRRIMLSVDPSALSPAQVAGVRRAVESFYLRTANCSDAYRRHRSGQR
ncbi:LysR family transcriptional regulator [Micromonospora sp. NPDC051141]|uniref:LysR family transcriptional regulator n=1 Tax=Micromonospora sp. NPDC051141 TaxID=3364284 RepID=UPI00379C0A24